MRIKQLAGAAAALLFLVTPQGGGMSAQNSDIGLNSELYHFMDRLDIKGQAPDGVPTDIKPYDRETVESIFREADQSNMTAGEAEWFELNRIQADDDFADDIAAKPILKAFYTNGRDLLRYRSDKLRIYANPVFYFSAGGDQHTYSSTLNSSLLNYRNTRGAQVRGSVLNKVGFFTEVTENQAKYPVFIRNNYDLYGRLWGEGFVKIFDNAAPTDNYGYDYFTARGYLTYSPVKEFRIKLGKDRAFWGNGYQSLLLSDHATDYFFLNLRTRIWKLEYVNHFTQMIDFIQGKPDTYGTYPRKYAVFHNLYFRPNPKMSFGFFESVVYSPTLPGQQRGIELEYFNPIIFYRSVEQSLGSPDNAIMGVNGKINFLNHFQVYGQICLDDFNFRVRSIGKGYFGNKYGWQAGFKYIDVAGITGLDAQLEYNRVRPYTYSHFNPAAAYTHYGQFLAHSMGANLYDFNFILRYQPMPRWSAYMVMTYALKGEDLDGDNYGGNPLRPYGTRVQDYNNFIGQGETVKVRHLYGRISYRLLRLDAFAEIEGRLRMENDFRDFSVLGSLRLNIPHKQVRY